MTISSNHAEEQRLPQRSGEGSILPLAIRQRLWDQVWTRLLAPPIDAGDRAPVPTPRNQRRGP